MNSENINNWGLKPWIEQEWRERRPQYSAESNIELARIINQKYHEYYCGLVTGHLYRSRVSGSFRKLRQKENYPVVGDWVVLEEIPLEEKGLIIDLLPRRSGIARWAAGNATREQCIAANIDIVFLVFALDGGRNFLRSMVERSLTAVASSRVAPIIVLNKIDCAETSEIKSAQEELQTVHKDIPVYCVSAKNGDGIRELAPALKAGETVSMLGKSGVGKSALINALLSIHSPSIEIQAQEGDIQGNKKGRHTTTVSQLYRLPWGAFIADVPGLRELKIWSDIDSLVQTFPDIEELITQCKYRNCRHGNEKGCAVQEAIRKGELDTRRFESYKKLQEQIHQLQERKNEKVYREGRKHKYNTKRLLT